MTDAPLVPGVFFNNSPGLKHDLPGEPDDPALQAPPAPPPAVDPELLKARESELAELRKGSDGPPLGQPVQVAFQRAAEALGLPAHEQQAISAQWLPTLEAFGLDESAAIEMVEIGRSVAQKAPDEATLDKWSHDAFERLKIEFGGDEAADRAMDLASAYVARDPRLVTYLKATGLEFHPRVTLAVAKAAHNARKAGKLKS
jgi:hypothetical protein